MHFQFDAVHVGKLDFSSLKNKILKRQQNNKYEEIWRNKLKKLRFRFRIIGIPIIQSVDDVQVLLDDHIVKSATMKGSPFIGPFEDEIIQWDVTLVSTLGQFEQRLHPSFRGLPCFETKSASQMGFRILLIIMTKRPATTGIFSTLELCWRCLLERWKRFFSKKYSFFTKFFNFSKFRNFLIFYQKISV